MKPLFFDYQTVEANLDWLDLTRALEAGHLLPKAQTVSTRLERGCDSVISLTAWIDGLGIAVKTPTVFPGNVGDSRPSVNGGFCLYSDRTGMLLAQIDFHAITKWKTAADSLLAALKLAPNSPGSITIAGAGTVARSMVEAYRAGFPDAQIAVWNRTPERAEKLAADYPWIELIDELEPAVRRSDIVCCTTMSTEPIVMGDWLQPGQHLDLIGSYRPDMREVDDEAIRNARIFVDSKEMASAHAGDLLIPMSSGVPGAEDIVADFYDISSGDFERGSEHDITLFKNSGGAHLDLMTARHILDVCEVPGQVGG